MKRIVILLVLLTLIVTACSNGPSEADIKRSKTLVFWYYDDGQGDDVRHVIKKELESYCKNNDLILEIVTYDTDEMSYDDYRKKLSIALSTGECDLVYGDRFTIKSMQRSLESVEDIEHYQDLMEIFKDGKFLTLGHYQLVNGLNKLVLEEYGLPTDDKVDIYQYFALKDEYRNKGGKLELNMNEVFELVDEVLLDKDYIQDLGSLNYEKLYSDYLTMIDMIYSGSYDYSEMESTGPFWGNKWVGNTQNFNFVIGNPDYYSNMLNRNNMYFIYTDYYIPYTDIRFYMNQQSLYDLPSLGLSLFSKQKDIVKGYFDHLLSEKFQQRLTGYGLSTMTGYDNAKPPIFYDYSEKQHYERDAYEEAESGDVRYDFQQLTLDEMLIKRWLHTIIYESVAEREVMESFDFELYISDRVTAFLVEQGER